VLTGRELEPFEELDFLSYPDSKDGPVYILSLLDFVFNNPRLQTLELVIFLAILTKGCHDFPLEKIQSDGKQATNTATPLSTIPQ
jgi:hypothetical protein